MAAGKKKSEEKGTGPRGIERMLRDNAEEQQASSPKRSPDLSGKTPEELTHELRVHQVELEIQAEELRQSKIALAESRDKYLDLYEFAPLGYLSLNDKARITEVNLSGAALLGIERNKLIKAPFSKFMLEKDSDQWHRYFLTVLKQEEKQSCTLMIQRSDGSAFPARLESIRLTGSDGATTVRIAFSDISDIWQIEALKESEERFDQLAEQSNTITWEVDPHGLYTYVSHVSTAVWGYRPDELVGRMHFYDLHAGPGREASKAAAFKIFEQKKPFKDLENAIQSRDGGVVWVSTNGIPLLNANGTLRGYRGSDTDITERKVAEEALNDNYLFMQTLIQTIPIPVFIKNRDGKYTGCNNTFETFFGQSRGEIIGKTVYDVAPKEIADEYFRTDEELINHPGTQHYEWRAVSKNGQTRDVIIDKATIMNSDGCATGIVGVMFDITERKVAEEEIKRQAALISSLLDSIPDIIFFKDIAGIYLGCNPPFAEFVGKSREEIVGRTDYDLFDKEIADFFRGHDKRMLELGEPRHNEEWITYPDGRKILIDTLKTPYWGPDETLVGILGISRDVTGRKRAENAVSEANKKLNILNSITRHDVLNQISVLVMTLELVGESVQGAEVLDYVKKAEGATERITRQIDFTREYQDIGVLEPTWQNVSDIIANEKEQLTTCPYDIRVDLGAIEIYADPLLPKVFYNLLENAVRHGEHVSTVRFSSRESEHGLTLVCEDNGAGVDAESKKHLFQQGFGKHTGFGLYLMREILGITDITIKETGEPWQGARFEMVVPDGMWRRNEMVRDGQVNNP